MKKILNDVIFILMEKDLNEAWNITAIIYEFGKYIPEIFLLFFGINSRK